MPMARSSLALLGAFALVGAFAGCGSGGPEPFAPGTTPAVAPAATGAHEPIGPGSPAPTSQTRFKRSSLQTKGPQEQP